MVHSVTTERRQMRQVIGTLGKLNEDSIPAAAWATLQQAFRNWKRAQ